MIAGIAPESIDANKKRFRTLQRRFYESDSELFSRFLGKLMLVDSFDSTAYGVELVLFDIEEEEATDIFVVRWEEPEKLEKLWKSFEWE